MGGLINEQPGDDETVVAAENTLDVFGVAVQQFGFEIMGGIDFRTHAPNFTQTLGSGYAGLGNSLFFRLLTTTP